MNSRPEESNAENGSPDEGLQQKLYDELRGMAAALFRDERRDHTLQPTSLVHEAYMRVVPSGHVDPQDRERFMAIAARAMRRVLVDHARRHRAHKRRGSWHRVTLDGQVVSGIGSPLDALTVEQVLSELERLHERHARVVELRYFGGLTIPETARVLAVSTTTIENDWSMARAWLRRRLRRAYDR